MSMQYIRKTYSVPAKRGGRIEFTREDGAVFSGRICGTKGAYLNVRFDCFNKTNSAAVLHPTYNIRYFEKLNCIWPLETRE